jgi:hypothetical protein
MHLWIMFAIVLAFSVAEAVAVRWFEDGLGARRSGDDFRLAQTRPPFGK